jgi:diguanylate cyclase (GGDEF)-like protein
VVDSAADGASQAVRGATLSTLPRGLLAVRGRIATVSAVTTVAALVWFLFGPRQGQLFGVRLATPVLTTMVAVGQASFARSDGLAPRVARFWRVLSLAMYAYAGAMIIDVLSLTVRAVFGVSLASIGEIVLYPAAAIVTVIALAIFPTSPQTPMARLKLVLDVAIVLFGGATFVWYFVASRRWQPSTGWHTLSSGLILPALTVVAGLAVIRIAMAGIQVIVTPTLVCFGVAAVVETAAIFLDQPADRPIGRLCSALQTIGLAVCVLGVEIQRHYPRPYPARRRTPWRRPFTVLPYGALTATVVLLLAVISDDVDYREFVVAIGVLALCAAVMARQLVSLLENLRLLSANRMLTQRLGYQAYHDHLTGLVNRELFADRVTQALHPRALDEPSREAAIGSPDPAEPSSVAVLFVDLDDFKIVNDSLGHQAGDDLLVAVAGRLVAAVGERDVLGRLGGDEFGVLVAEDARDRASEVAQCVITALSRPFQLAGSQVRVGASVGIAMADPHQISSDELLRNADVAMYEAKSAQKGGWRVFEPEMLERLLDRHRMRAALAQAVARAEFEVHYQPIADLRSGSVLGAEALVRWRCPGGLLVAPSEFVAVAEETGLIADIDRLVLSQACHQAARWRAEAPDGAGFALHVNLSARQLHRPDLVSDVEGVLAASRLPADMLTLEITESGLGKNHEAALQRLNGLSELGIHLAIDDFGTGYSSLAYLRRMPVDVLKIDKSFTDELLDERVGAPMAQAVVALATALGMQTVAEGIEDPAQVPRLLELGCQHGQGYHFGRPVTVEEMDRLLAASSPLAAARA